MFMPLCHPSKIDSELLLVRYWETRKKLAELPAAAFTVGELHAVNILFSDMNTPRRAPRGDNGWLSGNISQMENLILSVEAKKLASGC